MRSSILQSSLSLRITLVSHVRQDHCLLSVEQHSPGVFIVTLAICGSSVIGCWFWVRYSAALVMYCWVSRGSSSMFSPRAIQAAADWGHVVGDQLLQRRGEVVMQRVAGNVLTGEFPGSSWVLDVSDRDVSRHP